VRILAGLIVWNLAVASAQTLPEVPVKELPLAPELADGNPEYSGLAWWADTLVLLPENAYDYLPGIARADLVAAVAADTPAPLTGQSIPLDLNGALDDIPFVDGFEAIVFAEDRVFLLVETMRDAWIVGGMADKETGVTLDPGMTIQLPIRTRVSNTTAEALTWRDGKLICFHEANGANVLESPGAFQWAPGDGPVSPIPAPTLEYRLTDATLPDDAGRFWIANYMYPGDTRKLQPAPDAVTEEYGNGPTHASSDKVERLLEMNATENGIEFTDTPPVLLQLDESTGRNWEGIARLDGHGVLLITDQYPRAILGFIPTSAERPTK
jgi:hypothetical protein